jgi:hypothetical protein
MTRLKRRLKNLELQLTDVSRFAPHTPEWLVYWTVKVDRILKNEVSEWIPLEIVDAILTVGVDVENRR